MFCLFYCRVSKKVSRYLYAWENQALLHHVVFMTKVLWEINRNYKYCKGFL